MSYPCVRWRKPALEPWPANWWTASFLGRYDLVVLPISGSTNGIHEVEKGFGETEALLLLGVLDGLRTCCCLRVMKISVVPLSFLPYCFLSSDQVPMSKVNWDAKMDSEYINNYKVPQAGFHCLCFCLPWRCFLSWSLKGGLLCYVDRGVCPRLVVLAGARIIGHCDSPCSVSC